METGISKKVVGTSNGTEKEKEALVAKDKGKGKEGTLLFLVFAI